MFFAIVIPTYQREDGKTPFYLKRALDCVFNQTHKQFVVYLIGDHYENVKELSDIVSQYPAYKIRFKNLARSVERTKYTDKKILWTCGGLTATNYGIKMAKDEGMQYVCLIDHDDFWYNNHLESINTLIEKTGADWLCTKFDSVTHGRIPKTGENREYIKFYPLPYGIIKSSVCYNMEKIPLMPRNVYEETGTAFPSDADLWGRMAEHIKKNKLESFAINKVTGFHDTEKYILGNEKTAVFSTELKISKEELEKSKRDITVITCTGDRPEAFALLKKWMNNQIMKPKQWLVIDDGKVPIKQSSEFEYIRREPTKDDYTHTLCLNMEKVLDYVRYDKIIIMEDDDWYGPAYIDYMSKLLEGNDLVGFGNLIFYYPSIGKYIEKLSVKQPAFAQTAFSKSLIPIIKEICLSAPKDFELCGKGLIDTKLWKHSLNVYKSEACVKLTACLKVASGRTLPSGTIFRPPVPESLLRRATKKSGAILFYETSPYVGKKVIVKTDKYFSVGMKGMSGRAGTTTHQNKENRKYKMDMDHKLLKSILKNDAEDYLELFP
jgi:hypothetical protein